MELRQSHRAAIAVLVVLLLPILVGIPQLAGLLQTDPLVVTASITTSSRPGVLAGVPYIDPNAGFQTQALGHRSAQDWLAGELPWWNPFSGVGLPLAAEYQPGSFYPLTLLLLLPRGAALLHVILQCLSGLGSYLLLRRLHVSLPVAVTGGLLFAFNGTIAWFAHGPASVVPWLPWLLYGIERARHAAAHGQTGGSNGIAMAIWLSLVAGFPETAYINGLFCLAWAIVRGLGLEPNARIAFAVRVAIGGTLGLLLSAPQLAAFLEYLPHAHLGIHADMSHSALPALSAIPSLVAPYVYGPIFAYHTWTFLEHHWQAVGGYVTIALVTTATCGFWIRRDGLSWLLVLWVVMSLGKSFGIEPAVTLWNLVPGVDISAFARYAQPTWELALVVLASFALEAQPVSKGARLIAIAVGLTALAWAITVLIQHQTGLASSRGLKNSAIASIAWAALTLAAVVAWLGNNGPPSRSMKVAFLLVVDACLMAIIPGLSGPREAFIDYTAIKFLESNLGLQRFFTLGPIAPNYGAYFGLASINYNSLPVAQRWASEVQVIDPAHDDLDVLDGRRSTAYGSAAEHIDELQSLGVRYVVTPGHSNPYMNNTRVKRVYSDDILSILELPSPSPYWESTPACTLTAATRKRLTAECRQAATLVRRELAFPGWSAAVNGTTHAVSQYGRLFQSISLPAGRSEVEFVYRPRYARLASGIALLAGCIIGFGAIRGLRPKPIA